METHPQAWTYLLVRRHFSAHRRADALPRATRNTITSRERLLAALERVRERGFATDDGA